MNEVMATVTLADLGAALCVLLLLWIAAFGGRIWRQNRSIRTIWQAETRDETAEALRRSRPLGSAEDDEKHGGG
jgi:hypothetical protein